MREKGIRHKQSDRHRHKELYRSIKVYQYKRWSEVDKSIGRFRQKYLERHRKKEGKREKHRRENEDEKETHCER